MHPKLWNWISQTQSKVGLYIPDGCHCSLGCDKTLAFHSLYIPWKNISTAAPDVLLYLLSGEHLVGEYLIQGAKNSNENNPGAGECLFQCQANFVNVGEAQKSPGPDATQVLCAVTELVISEMLCPLKGSDP